jgi:hypothetical protein
MFTLFFILQNTQADALLHLKYATQQLIPQGDLYGLKSLLDTGDIQ